MGIIAPLIIPITVSIRGNIPTNMSSTAALSSFFRLGF